MKTIIPVWPISNDIFSMPELFLADFSHLNMFYRVNKEMIAPILLFCHDPFSCCTFIRNCRIFTNMRYLQELSFFITLFNVNIDEGRGKLWKFRTIKFVIRTKLNRKSRTGDRGSEKKTGSALIRQPHNTSVNSISNLHSIDKSGNLIRLKIFCNSQLTHRYFRWIVSYQHKNAYRKQLNQF